MAHALRSGVEASLSDSLLHGAIYSTSWGGAVWHFPCYSAACCFAGANLSPLEQRVDFRVRNLPFQHVVIRTVLA
jgi:hypothetical protein